MTGTQDRAVTAMRAIADTVTAAPPLRLPPHTAAAGSPPRHHWLDGIRAGHLWRLWLVPTGAAAAVVALAVSLVLVRSAPKESAAPALTETSAPATAVGPDGVPPYYVALPAIGWYSFTPATGGSAAANVLVVGETTTGKRLATVSPPQGMTFNLVSAAADDRTFVVGATSYTPSEKTVNTSWSETWYLLRISPGTAHVAQLTRLSIPELPDVTGAAISPDGTELAVAWQQPINTLGTSSYQPVGLAVMSLATGKELLHWGAAQGRITATVPAAGSTPQPFDISGLASALRWTPDGRELALAWKGSQIRLLDLDRTAPSSYQGDLVKLSTPAGYTIGTGDLLDGVSLTCYPILGWSLSTGARTFTCAGSFTQAANAVGPGCGEEPQPAIIQQIALPGGAGETTTLARAGCPAAAGMSFTRASVGWTSADGSRAIAMLGAMASSDDGFGVYTKKTFTALPTVLANGAYGAIAW